MFVEHFSMSKMAQIELMEQQLKIPITSFYLNCINLSWFHKNPKKNYINLEIILIIFTCAQKTQNNNGISLSYLTNESKIIMKFVTVDNQAITYDSEIVNEAYFVLAKQKKNSEEASKVPRILGRNGPSSMIVSYVLSNLSLLFLLWMAQINILPV